MQSTQCKKAHVRRAQLKLCRKPRVGDFLKPLASCHTGQNLKHLEDKLQVGRISFIWF